MNKNKNLGFTIVELLVVIVVIGILAAITIVSYSNISTKANIASLQSDLVSDSKQLKLYNVEYGYYPSALGIDNCPSTPNPDTRYCLKASPDTTITYTGGGQSFMLRAVKSGQSWVITENSAPYAAGVPVVNNNTVASITSSTANVGATVVSDGGAALTDAGICWGLTANPTTNCLSGNGSKGLLTALSPTSIGMSGTYAPGGGTISPDGKSVYVLSWGSSKIVSYNRDLSTKLLTLSATPTIATGSNPENIVISSDGKSVYVSNGDSNTISMYSRDSLTSYLTALSTPIASGTHPFGIDISPDGTSVYVANYSASTLSMYSRDISTGILTVKVESPIATGSYPHDVVVSNDGKNVYVTNESSKNISMYSRDLSTGVLTALGTPTISTGSTPYGIAISRDGTSVYTANASTTYSIRLFSRNPSTGLLAAQTPAFIDGFMNPQDDVVVSSDGATVYSADFGGAVNIFSRNPSNGALSSSPIQTISAGNNTKALIISSDDVSVYAISWADYIVNMYSRNTGAVFVGTPFAQSRIGLSSGTTIHYRGYGTNSVGTGYSTDSTFVTP